MARNTENIKSKDQTFKKINSKNNFDENTLNNDDLSIHRPTYTKNGKVNYYVGMDDIFDYFDNTKTLSICEMEGKKQNGPFSIMDIAESSGYSSIQSKSTNLGYVIGYDNEISSSSSFSNSSNDSAFVIPGMAIPIDDNEYAVLGALECDDNFSYKIYTPNEGDNVHFIPHLIRNTLPSDPINIENKRIRKSLSFSTSKTNQSYIGISQDALSLDSFSTVIESISSSTQTSNSIINGVLCEVIPIIENVSISINKEESVTTKSNQILSELHEQEILSSVTLYGNIEKEEFFDKTDNTDINIQKDNNKSISTLFENNGLFMRKDHQIFTQTYSRKVFVGGLPRDISIDEIEEQFFVFGSVHVDWPNREDEIVPPNGFAFLHFDSANSVMKLYNSVNKYQSKNKYVVSSKSVKNKEVEIKFWKMSDSEILFIDRAWINPRRTVFVGALPRISTAHELADFMNKTFSGVAYAAIDVDLTYGYPKGAGRVTFNSDESYKRALDSHYVEMDTRVNSKKKRIEIKPFLLPDQKCDACPTNRISRCANKYCYRCCQFICDNCEQNTVCVDKKRHNVVGRCVDQSQSPYEANFN